MTSKLIGFGAAAAMALTSFGAAAPALAHDGGYDRYDSRYESRGYDDDAYRDADYRRRARADADDWRYRDGYRCRKSKGTTGLIVGAVAGGLLGRAVVGRYGDRTAGAIVGAGAGALAGRAIDRSGSRRC
jgi:uncharacterized protein YcfJ